MGMPKNLFLIRHGESEGNLVNKKFIETGDTSLFSENFLNLHESQYNLTEKGIEQAKLTGKWLRENNLISFDRMLVSNNNRAMQTAAYLDLQNPQWMIDFNLRERENGLFNLINKTQRFANCVNQEKFHDSQPFLFRPPQGESMADVAQRIKIILNTLARECDGKDVIIVCHGHVIRTFRIIIEHMSLSQSNEYLNTEEAWGRVPNCAIIHYTRLADNSVTEYFNRFKIIRPAGGGELEDPFSKIIRKKYSNEELILEAQKNYNH
jgi:broad specificity phosphatase PhoE